MRRHYLIVDLGTGNSRVVLATSDGEILGVRTFTNTYYRDEAYGDAQYFLPEEWQARILKGAEELSREFPDIAVDAVTSAGSRQSFVMYDREGRAVMGLPNIDNRGRAYMGEIPEQEEMYRISGKWVTEDVGAAKMFGYRKVYPEVYESFGSFTSISEWIGEIFTGKIAIEPSMACESQLYSIIDQDWSELLCSRYGIDKALLPPLMKAGQVLGPVLPDFRERFHMAEDAVFVIGGADTQTALMQTDMGEGDLAIVSGTTTPVVACRKDPLYDPKQGIWVDAGLGGESCQLESNPGTTGLNYQRAKAMLLPEVSYQELEAAYAKKDAYTCIASFTSLDFQNQRSMRKTGFFLSKPPYDAAWEKMDMLWAVLADIACATWRQMSYLQELTDNRAPHVWGCGGGFQSPALCQMLADLSGRELWLKPGYEQATAQGLIRICNGATNTAAELSGGEKIVYRPRKDQLIHKYYYDWHRNVTGADQIN